MRQQGEPASILVVDDHPASLRAAEGLLREAGHTDVRTLQDPHAAVAACREAAPDLLLLDLEMPALDGFGVLTALDDLLHEPTLLPVLCLASAEVGPEERARAVALGARDFLTKPLEAGEVAVRVGNVLHAAALHRELDATRREMVERLALAAEYRDDQTHEHALRIGRLAGLIGRRLGLPPEELETLEAAAPLHDVGKIGIPDGILLKPGPLTDAERSIMGSHTTIGAHLLDGGGSELLRVARDIAHSHHERFDGTGYPDGLAGRAIPLAARIVAVADVFDALANDRPHKSAWSADEARGAVAEGSGTAFDPDVVAAFLDLDPQDLEPEELLPQPAS